MKRNLLGGAGKVLRLNAIHLLGEQVRLEFGKRNARYDEVTGAAVDSGFVKINNVHGIHSRPDKGPTGLEPNGPNVMGPCQP